ncbi:hypothetical protein HUA74_02705 [Myxococcus sp. CA051A]|uniref:Uncharacterized protein n=1 Tax=Myxococcus llanfairpwllgwyngyllgogerychwyrndrobwllllantysiliogogogochensis TaxID=2590453 RepID=A0A540WYF7_9BACT|nr:MULTISPECIES: hypothetical protein [Myxococcus]NTX59564.1 hypothetical protein [Myxococcus sp. CA051A]TQF14047.1 hypothetical protein FJV41_20835 [Myxococcus llanfairpwllgwyngyllgogerychwyrndrobwllllantysiliogogogochensis]
MPEATVAYVQAIHLLATAATAPAEANRLDGISEAPVNMSADTVDGNYLGGDGWKRTAVTLKGFEIPLSGHLMVGSATHALLKTLFDTSATGYLAIVKDAEADPGAVGVRYPVKVSSYEEGRSASDVLTISATLVGQGKPVDF